MRLTFRTLLAAAVLAAGFSATGALADGLFAPSSAKAGPGWGDGPGVVRWRPTDIDVNYLMRGISEGVKGAGQSSTLSLNLFDDVTAPIEVWDTSVPGAPAERVLSGWVPNAENSLATIVVNGGEVRGKVWMNETLYRFRPQPGGGYAIAEVDTSRFPEAQDSPLPGERPASKAVSTARTEGEPIDVLVLWTNGAAKKFGKGYKDEVTLWVAEMNEMHRRSGATKSDDRMFRLVGTRIVTYKPMPNTKVDVERLAGKDDGYMDEIHKWRDEVAADRGRATPA